MLRPQQDLTTLEYASLSPFKENNAGKDYAKLFVGREKIVEKRNDIIKVKKIKITFNQYTVPTEIIVTFSIILVWNIIMNIIKFFFICPRHTLSQPQKKFFLVARPLSPPL